MGMYIDEIAHFPANGIVEIDEKLPLPLEEERPQLIFNDRQLLHAQQ